MAIRIPRKGRNRILLAASLSAAALVLGQHRANADGGTFTWDGLGADANWSTNGNWVGGTAPVLGDIADNLVFDGSTQLAPVNASPATNLLSSIASLTFATNAGKLTLSAVNLANPLTVGAAGITSYSSNTQTISQTLAVAPGVSTTWTSSGSNSSLVYSGGVTLGAGSTLTASGYGAHNFGQLNVQGNATLVNNGTFGYTNGTLGRYSFQAMQINGVGGSGGSNTTLYLEVGSNVGTLNSFHLTGTVTYSGTIEFQNTNAARSDVYLDITQGTTMPSMICDIGNGYMHFYSTPFSATSTVTIISGVVANGQQVSQVMGKMTIGGPATPAYFPRGTLTVTDLEIVGNGSFNNGGNAITGSTSSASVLNMTAGTFRFANENYISGNWAQGVNIQGGTLKFGSDANTTYDFTGGLNISGGGTLLIAPQNPSTSIIMSGQQTFTIGVTPADQTNGANLNYSSGNIASATYFWGYNQTIGGYGHIVEGANSTSFSYGSTLAPGGTNGAGFLSVDGSVTFQSGAGLQFTLNPANASSLNMTGTNSTLFLPFGGGVMSLTLGSASTAGTYNIINYFNYNGPTGPGGDITSTFGVYGLPNRENAKVLETGTGAGDIQVVIGTNIFNSSWVSASGGTWSVSNNWSSHNVPGLLGDTATFGTSLLASGTVTLDGPQTLSNAIFNNAAASYTIGAVGGTNALTIDGGTNVGTVAVLAGTHTVNAHLYVGSSGANLTFSNSAGLTVGAVSGTALGTAGPLAVSGAGKLTVATGGSLPFNASLSITGSNTSVALSNNHGAGIGAAHLNTFNSLAINSGATLDLGNNALMINYSGTNTPLVQVASLVNSGRGTSGLWTGNGITSSFAHGIATNNTTSVGIGYNEASTVAAFNTNFLGTAITTNSTAVLVVPTLYGDITLQGTVNLDDLNIFAANFGKPTNKGWAAGDFLDEGSVTLDDLNLFAANFGKSLTSFPALTPAEYAQGEVILSSLGTTSPVPEPGSLSLLALGAGALLARRRQRRRFASTG